MSNTGVPEFVLWHIVWVTSLLELIKLELVLLELIKNKRKSIF